jgi:hypothetical protein
MVRKAMAAAGELSVPAHLLPVWDAFDLLCRGRMLGFTSIQRIPISEIEACRRMLDITGGLRFCRLVQAMDDVYISAFIESRPKR